MRQLLAAGADPLAAEMGRGEDAIGLAANQGNYSGLDAILSARPELCSLRIVSPHPSLGGAVVPLLEHLFLDDVMRSTCVACMAGAWCREAAAATCRVRSGLPEDFYAGMHAGGDKCMRCKHTCGRARQGYTPHLPGRASFSKTVSVLLKHGLRADDAAFMEAVRKTVFEMGCHPAYSALVAQLVEAGETAGPSGSAGPSGGGASAASAAAPPRPPPACWQCGKTGVKLQRCSGCMKARYCSAACQKLQWKTHKAECASMKKPAS